MMPWGRSTVRVSKVTANREVTLPPLARREAEIFCAFKGTIMIFQAKTSAWCTHAGPERASHSLACLPSFASQKEGGGEKLQKIRVQLATLALA